MGRSIEDRVAVTNRTKGKIAIIMGPVMTWGGGVLSLYKYADGKFHDENDLIPGAIVAGLGIATYIYGKIKHWYWNS